MDQAADRSDGRVLAGIDEAGYGPLLGPLVIGATAWITPDDCDGADLWTRLRGGVSRTPSRRFARLAINDSKKLYSRRKGLADLERGVLGTLGLQGEGGLAPPARLGELLARVAPHCAVGLDEHPWYDGYDRLAIPLEADPGELGTRSNGLRVAMQRTGIRFLGAGLEIVLEGRFNRLHDALANKGMMLFSCTARLIQRLFDRFAGRRLTVVCDKQGARDSYRRVLMQHWPDLHLSIIDERPDRSSYILSDPDRPGRAMELVFVPKADATCLPVALASMYCKYTRELFMHLLNRFWQARVGADLSATAGYYCDGQRFIGQVTEAAARLGLPTDRFVRRC